MASPLHWQNKSPGIYQRDIDQAERFYLSACLVKSPVVNKADWHLNAGVKLECSRPNFVTDVKNAWIRTRFDYPALAATIVGDKWLYRTADPTELAEWLDETFQVHRQSFTARELMSEDLLVPTPRIALHVLPNTQELMIQGPHTHLDGFGIIKVFRHIISCLVRLPLLHDVNDIPPVQFGSEAQRLALPMSITCRIPPCHAEDKRKWDQSMDEFIDPKNKIYLSTRNETSPPRFSRTQWMVFDMPSTKSLQGQARIRGVSIAAIVQGAVSLAARQHAGCGETAKRHAIQGLYSAREYVDSSVANGEEIITPLVLGVPLTYTLHNDFQDLIEDANTVLQKGKADDFGLRCSHLWGSDLPRAFAAPLPEGKKIRAEPQVSYVGHTDAYLPEWYEDESIEGSLVQCVDYWVSLDMLSANVVNSVFIFRGRLHMSLAYNETFHSEESMSEYLGLIRNHIERGLDIQANAQVRRPGQEEWMPEPMSI